MTTWHISIIFQASRGATITDDVVGSIHDAVPEFTAVSRIADDQLEFVADVDHESSTHLYAMAYGRAAEASTDMLGFPVEFLRSEVVRYDHWLDQIDSNGEIRAWASEGNDA